jgi:hypothetical protein
MIKRRSDRRRLAARRLLQHLAASLIRDAQGRDCRGPARPICVCARAAAVPHRATDRDRSDAQSNRGCRLCGFDVPIPIEALAVLRATICNLWAPRTRERWAGMDGAARCQPQIRASRPERSRSDVRRGHRLQGCDLSSTSTQMSVSVSVRTA